MSPLYFEKQKVLGITKWFNFQLKTGRDIVFKNQDKVMIKRIANVDKKNKTLRVKGLNLMSVNSEKIGDVAFKDILAVVIYKFK